MATSGNDNGNQFAEFGAASLKAWEVAAREELNGENPWEKLGRKGDGWTISPFYGPENAANLPSLLEPSGNEYLGVRAWHNCPRIVVADAKKSNELALQYLQQGADGIFFELNNTPDFNTLLQNIDLAYCSLNFSAKRDQQIIANALQTFLKNKKPLGESLQGAFFGNEVVRSNNDGAFRFSGLVMPDHSNPSESIAAGFHPLMNSPFDPGQIAFSTHVGKDFFLELCKLRAIRIVWKKLLFEKGLETGGPVFIHAASTPWIENNYEPHGNMLKATSAAMAAILGGCDVLTVDAENNDHPMMSRIARNVSNILREESFFSKVADPTAGSYFIEDLTHQIAEGAWKLISKS